jgi:hypothetical protein
MMARYLVLAALVAFAWPPAASASLGGTAASVDADRVHLEGALLRIARAGPYSVHEIQSAAGTVVREFVSPAGTVFGVAWQGPWIPDLKQVLGAYFDQYRAALRSRTGRRRRGPISIDTPGLVVQMAGHPRSFSGRAYVPQLVPDGVEPATIR